MRPAMPPPSLENLEPAALAAVEDHAARLKHDLGKYVALQQRWLGPDPDPAELEQALRADLLATRRGPSGTVDAAAVWAEFRPGLVGAEALASGAVVDLSDHPDVRRIDAGVAEIRLTAAALRADDIDAPQIERGAAAARDVAEACSDLLRRARSVRGS